MQQVGNQKMERRKHTEEDKKRRRLHYHIKRRETRRLLKPKAVQNLTATFQVMSPEDSAIGFSTSSTQDTVSLSPYTVDASTPHGMPALEAPEEDDGLPVNPIWEIARKETNALRMKLWEEKKERERKFGYGQEAKFHKAINPVAEPCKFEEVAEDLIETKLKPVERYAVKRYIMELKEREVRAVTSTRIYRDKLEKCQLVQKKKAVEGQVRLQEQREYYRNSIQEGRTRSGLILGMTKKGKRECSS